MELPEGLLECVRSYLDITWVDADLDLKLTGIIERGMKYINGIAGSEKDYMEDDKPKELLLDYCRYVRSNALDQFKVNYLHELISLQMNEEVAYYEANNPTI